MSIDRRRFLTDVAKVGAGALMASRMSTAGAQGEPQQPNILFIMTDQHRRDIMGAYGNAVIDTPHMDRLGEEGTRFDGYYIATFPCSPSRATLITGLHPQSHGVIQNNIKLNEDLPTFATELASAGYHTTWMGKWHLGGPNEFIPANGGELPRVQRMKGPIPGENMPQNGFQDGLSIGRDWGEYLQKQGLDPKRRMAAEDGHSVIPEEHFLETYFTNNAIQYLRERAADDQPFCLGVSYHGPHRPMTPPQPWDTMYDPADIPLPQTLNDPMTNAPKRYRESGWRMYGIDLDNERERLKKALVYPGEMWDLLDRPEWTEQEYRELAAHYYGYVSYIDAQIGRILQAVDQSGLAQNTLVIYTSDHGDYLGGHGRIFKSYAMYDCLQRVPLIVRGPQLPQGHVSEALCSSVDIMPTLLDFAGVPVPESVEGRSFLPILRAETETHRDATFTSFALPNLQQRMVRTERYKYSMNVVPPQVDELYDMKDDPHEMENLAVQPGYDAVIDRHKQLIYEFTERIDDPWAERIRMLVDLAPLVSLRFDFDQKHQGLYWQSHRGISNLAVRDGKLHGHIDCPGYMVAEFAEPIAGDDYPILEIRMSATGGRYAQFYWATEDRPQMAEAMSKLFPITSDGRQHTYRLNLGDHKLWGGKSIAAIRLNPIRRKSAEDATPSGDFAIDYIGPPRSE